MTWTLSTFSLSVILTTRRYLEISENIKCNYLVGADGAHSYIRKHMPVSFLGEATSGHIVTGDIHVKSGLDRKVRSFEHRRICF
jgi:2-polyprenyl-6-methoxyphenol hydroxylase-like FAD-dependent oxidoreductase